jgi:hypothetical protein
VDLWGKLSPRLKSIHTLLMILMTLGYLLATHLSTIGSLETALAGKADRSELILLDKKLTRIEVLLEEALITKKELGELRELIDRKMMEMALRQRRSYDYERDANDGK